MRRLSLFFCFAVLVCGCSDYTQIGSGVTDGDEYYSEQELDLSLYPRSIIKIYYDVPADLFYFEPYAGKDISIRMRTPIVDKEDYENVPKYHRDAMDPDEQRKYRELMEKHGDTFYDKRGTDAVDFENLEVLACDINHINVSSSETWDVNHPAGSSLNDLFNLQYVIAHYPMIQNGYKVEGASVPYYETYPYNVFSKPLDEIVPGDLWCLDIRSSITICFKDFKRPAVDVHEFTVTFDTDKGDIRLTQTKDFSKL